MAFMKHQSERRYLRRTPVFNLILFVLDVLLICLPKRRGKDNGQPPARILLANGAHMGDVVMSTSVLPILKAAYPAAQIGFLVGSWSRAIVADHPMIDFVHTVDHWRLNREEIALHRKIRCYWTTRRNALREIKRREYDIAIDLYTCYPNSIPLLWQARIPSRIGFISSGFGPLLTSGVSFPNVRKHETHYQADLLRCLSIDDRYLGEQRSVLPEPGPDAMQEVCDLLNVKSLVAARYRVIHMGSGLPAKEWPIESWRALVKWLAEDRVPVLLTGLGQRETENIEQVAQGLPICVPAPGKLSWQGYLAAIRYAELLYCTDSLAGHLAAVFEVPCIVIYAGITAPDRWGPISAVCQVLTHPVPCAPCHRKQGCKEVQCMRGILPEHVYVAGKNLLPRI